MQSPLKAALTGLELLLARAQIWQESAAKHVSLEHQLEGVAGLATRWRRLELASWQNLLTTTRLRHAAGGLSQAVQCHCWLLLEVKPFGCSLRSSRQQAVQRSMA